MKRITKLNKIIYTLIFASLSLLVFIMSIEEVNMDFYKHYSKIYQFYHAISFSLKDFDIMYVTLGIFIYYAYYNIYFDDKKLNYKNLINCLIAILLTFLTIVGKNYKIDNTLGMIFNTKAQIVKCLLLSLGYYFIYYAITKKATSIKIDISKINISKKNFLSKITNIIDKYQIIIAIIVILLGWLPYIVFYFPGASTGDTFDSLSQFFHQDESWSIKTINLINQDMYINKHHPPLFTIILGLVFQIGKIIGSYKIGNFIYTILQITLLLIIFTFMLKYMKKKEIPLWIRIASILFISLTPTIGAYAISAIKDTPSAIFTLLYVIFLLQIVRNYDSVFKKKTRVAALIIIILLILMLRNNGIFTIILSFPFLILLYKNKWKKISLILITCLLIFGVYDKIILYHFDITDGSIKETLTIPFMQIGRVIHYNSEDFSEEEINKINKVLKFDVIKEYYDPDLADYVKDSYNKNATNQQLKAFFKIWFKYFKKYPIVYIESIVNSTYGYFFPEVGEDYAYLAVDARIGSGTYINIDPVAKYQKNREVNHLKNQIFAKFPFSFLFNHVAFYDWFLIISCLYIIKCKKYKYLIPLLPLVSVLLVCLASPINGSFRYILPIVFSIPIIFTIDYLVTIEKKVNTKL